MDDRSKVTITLADGSTFSAEPDGAGNLITTDNITEEMFTKENMETVTIKEDGVEAYQYKNQVNRTFIRYGNGQTMIRLDEKTDMEKLQDENTALQAANDMLTECILEMSEIIYGE